MTRGPAAPRRSAPAAGAVRDVRLPLAGFGDEPAPDTPKTVRLCLLGFGSVARALCELLATQERVLAERHGLRVLITAAGTRRGSLLEPAGLTPAEVLAARGRQARRRRRRPCRPQSSSPPPAPTCSSSSR